MQTTLLFRIAMLLIVTGIQAEECAESFAPCTCTKSSVSGDLDVTCYREPLLNITDVFSSTTTTMHIHLLKLTLSPSDDSNIIPANFLNGKYVKEIYISCPSETFPLKIDSDAFGPNANFTGVLRISGCDLIQLDLAFLEKFTNLNQFFIRSSVNLHILEDLPALPSLTTLSITNCEGLEELNKLPPLTSQLKSLYLSTNNITDQTAELILSHIAASPSGNTLEFLTLASNQLTKIPDAITSFPQLNEIILSTGNVISVITNNTLSFPVKQTVQLYLAEVGLNVVEPGGLQGNFSSIYLNNNNLKNFNSNIFQSLLEEMVRNGLRKTLHIDSNPINCDCGLKWLITENRELMSAVYGGTCSNSTTFEELNPSGFGDCTSSSKSILWSTTNLVFYVVILHLTYLLGK